VLISVDDSRHKRREQSHPDQDKHVGQYEYYVVRGP
jgi:hypothetical protein